MAECSKLSPPQSHHQGAADAISYRARERIDARVARLGVTLLISLRWKVMLAIAASSVMAARILTNDAPANF